MEKEFAPYQPSLDMKGLGFDEPCFGSYVKLTETQNTFFMNDVVSEIDRETPLHESLITKAPTFSQAYRWFREKYQMMFCYEPCLKKDLTYIFFIYIEATGEKIFVVESKYDEEVELACLIKLIEIANEK